MTKGGGKPLSIEAEKDFNAFALMDPHSLQLALQLPAVLFEELGGFDQASIRLWVVVRNDFGDNVCEAAAASLDVADA